MKVKGCWVLGSGCWQESDKQSLHPAPKTQHPEPSLHPSSFRLHPYFLSRRSRRVLSFPASRTRSDACCLFPARTTEAEKPTEMKTDLRPRTVEQSTASKTLQAARPAPPSDAPETAPIHQTITPEQSALAAQATRSPLRPPSSAPRWPTSTAARSRAPTPGATASTRRRTGPC